MPFQACDGEPVTNRDPESSVAGVEGGQVSSGVKTTNTDFRKYGSDIQIDGIVSNVLWDVASKRQGKDNAIINRYHTSIYQLDELKGT